MHKSAVAVLEPEVLAPAVEASWYLARQLVSEIGDWHKIIELGHVLQTLKEEYFRVGQGSRSDLRPHADESSAKPTKEGWQETVRRELGMSHQSALRAIERGYHVEKIAALLTEPELEYETSQGKMVKVVPTESMREKAKEVLVDVIQGANAGRAWAGLVGEETRRGRLGTSDRAPVNHAENLRVALVKLKNSLKKWGQISPKERAAIEELWSDQVASYIPDTWAR